MTKTNPGQHKRAIQRSLASLYALIDNRGEDPATRPSPFPPQNTSALEKLLAQECAQLTSSADTRLTIAKHVCKALRLHLWLHEVSTFVESDNGHLISCLINQAEAFIHRHQQDETVTAHRASAIISSLQKQFRVKSHTLHQLPCTPTTTAKRVELIKKYLTPTSRILCLGDDDFVSVALALVIPNEIMVVDLDPQVTTMIKRLARQQHLRISCQTADIRKPLPENFYHIFDVVVTDPIYSFKEMLLFLSVAESCLRPSAQSYLLSCCSRTLAGAAWHGVEDWAASRGLIVHEVLSGFNEYLKTTRIQTLLKMAERLLCRSAVTKACVGIPFLYSDLVVFRFDRSERGNEL